MSIDTSGATGVESLPSLPFEMGKGTHGHPLSNFSAPETRCRATWQTLTKVQQLSQNWAEKHDQALTFGGIYSLQWL